MKTEFVVGLLIADGNTRTLVLFVAKCYFYVTNNGFEPLKPCYCVPGIPEPYSREWAFPGTVVFPEIFPFRDSRQQPYETPYTWIWILFGNYFNSSKITVPKSAHPNWPLKRRVSFIIKRRDSFLYSDKTQCYLVSRHSWMKLQCITFMKNNHISERKSTKNVQYVLWLITVHRGPHAAKTSSFQ